MFSKRLVLRLFQVVLLLSVALVSLSQIATAASPSVQEHRLLLFDPNTHERINVVYRRGDSYLGDAVGQLDHFLRDHRTGDVVEMAPGLFDLLSDLTTSLGRPGSEIEMLCGYRTPESNEFLRQTTFGVAKHSQHVRGAAIDIRIPGVPTARLRDAALNLRRGGVGYYPEAGFIHVDLGPVRRWAM